MSHETGKVDEQLRERAKFDVGDQFIAGGDAILAVYKRWYDFDNQKFYYQVKNHDWKNSEWQTPFTEYEEGTLEGWELYKRNDEIEHNEEHNIDEEPLQISSEELKRERNL